MGDSSFNSAKKSPISCQTSVPPDRPCQSAADQTDQLEALVDRHQIIFGAARLANARCDSPAALRRRLPSSSNRIFCDDLVPGIEREQATRWRRPDWDTARSRALRRALEKERHVDRHHQAVPLAIGHLKSGRKRTRRGTRLYFVSPWLLKRIAQASQAQISSGWTGSSRC